MTFFLVQDALVYEVGALPGPSNNDLRIDWWNRQTTGEQRSVNGTDATLARLGSDCEEPSTAIGKKHPANDDRTACAPVKDSNNIIKQSILCARDEFEQICSRQRITVVSLRFPPCPATTFPTLLPFYFLQDSL
jgi:hypothetical protein